MRFVARWSAHRSLVTIAAVGLFLLLEVGCGGVPATQSSEQDSDSGSQTQVVHTSVLTHLNSNFRDGLNLTETRLTPTNVGPSTFGRLAAFPVEGYVYAQPLYVPGVAMPGGSVSNLVFIATEHDQLYAFDVDSKKLAWHVDYLASSPDVSTISQDDVKGCDDLIPEIGITGTPVIDPASNTLYVVVRTKEVVNHSTVFYQRLHAVDLSTGQEPIPAKVISGPPPDYASTGLAVFDPLLNNQRAALLLAHGQVIVAWASHCDIPPYAGWLMAFDQRTLQPTAYWTPVPYSSFGGIWISGSGPSVDRNGDIYVPVANGGDHQEVGPKSNYRNSLVRLQWSANDGFTVADYFTPYNYQDMDDGDVDFCTSAPLLLPDQIGRPHPHLLIERDKVGGVYVLDRDDLGKWQATDNSQIVQSFAHPGLGLSSMLFWDNTLFIGGGLRKLSAYNFDPVTQQFNTVPKADFRSDLDSHAPTPALSANGNRDAILWIITDHSKGKHAVLHALKPEDITVELYSSSMMPDRDTAGLGVKFVVPTIADGFVFVGTQGEVDMYGLLTP
jgi:hypothetical protein